MEWINSLLQGVLLGGYYALLAAGLSFMFGVMKIVNLAHGASAILGAYAAYVLVSDFGVHWSIVLLIVIPLMAAGGYLLQRGLLNRSLKRGELASIVVTFGVAVILSSLLQEVFSADTRIIPVGSFSTASIQVSESVSLGVLPLLTFLVGVLVVVCLQLFLSHTSYGRAMRATSDDQETVQLLGIDNRRLYAMATAIAMATVGIGGVLLGMRTQFTPVHGDLILIFAFEAVIIGGLGSLWGTLLGGTLLGLAQTIGAQLMPGYGVLIGHIVFIVVLLLRPNGLLGASAPRAAKRSSRAKASLHEGVRA